MALVIHGLSYQQIFSKELLFYWPIPWVQVPLIELNTVNNLNCATVQKVCLLLLSFNIFLLITTIIMIISYDNQRHLLIIVCRYGSPGQGLVGGRGSVGKVTKYYFSHDYPRWRWCCHESWFSAIILTMMLPGKRKSDTSPVSLVPAGINTRSSWLSRIYARYSTTMIII